MSHHRTIERICKQCNNTFFIELCYAVKGEGQFCRKECYDNWRTLPVEERFINNLRRIHIEQNGCILWPGKKKVGYSRYGLIRNNKGILPCYVPAHRLSYQCFIGPIPDGLEVMHRCDNPPCLNPAHLVLGTHGDNMRDMISKGRGPLGERSSFAKLTSSQVIEIRQRYQTENLTQEQLGNEYGVKGGLVSRIVNRLIWKHI